MAADLDLDQVALREPGLEAFEILTSESQERMLAVVRPEAVEEAAAVCAKWGLAARRVGKLRRGSSLRVTHRGVTVADVPARALAGEAPVYERPRERPGWLDRVREDDPAAAPPPRSLEDAFLTVLGTPGIASSRWAFEQYDFLVQGGTVAGPGGDAAVIRLEGTVKAVAVSTDGNGRYGHLDPYLGGAHAVAEAARNVAAVGARPLAMTNCLNFGNPERPEVMWAFAETVRGMADACAALGTPVTGGNVSFYNESGGSAVYPTPVVGMLGVLDDYRLRVGAGFEAAGLTIYLLGSTFPELGGSEFADRILGRVSGRPPALDLEAESRLHRLLQEAAGRDVLASAHDLSDGGLAVALAECGIWGGIGITVGLPGSQAPHLTLFSESASRAVVTPRSGREGELEELAAFHHVPLTRLGLTGGSRLRFEHAFEVELSDAVVVYEGALPTLMSGQRLAG
jgi:phosphoribosylformylglycinamidine synthase